ncbi:hypothetical protein [Acinetobacter sp. Marseille-Q1618]|uniref:hypothetical protein n=1 Tax=Acinetobacter sp. Marseille-Q1618 TaxID=2697502 RepID=UPI0015713A20|nr:hypothetical protein [Acinetobacter sp. Marseille-Q1618]
MIHRFLFATAVILSCAAITPTYAASQQHEVQTATETSKASASHQADFNLFIRLMEQVDMQKMTMMTEEGEENSRVEQKAQVAEVIKNLQALSQSLDQAKFITPEGKKVKAAFVAYNDDSIYLLKNQEQWENDEKQKEKLIANSMQLNQTLIEALQNLKMLARQ